MNKVKCRLCGKQSKFLHKGVRHASELEVYYCSSCGLAFLNPFPAEDEMRKYYEEEDVYHKEDGDPDVEERFKIDLPEARIRAERVARELGRKSEILEIGSGSGAFLHCIRAKVKKAYGVELNGKSVEWMRRKKPDCVDDINRFKGKKFDSIIMLHVLEHIHSPVDFLMYLKNYLSKGGRLFIEVPNHDDALNKLYELPEFKDFNYCKPHLLYFSAKALKKTLRMAGFDSKVRGIQRYDLSKHMRWLQTRRPGGQGYYGKFSEKLKDSYARFLVQSGYSDTLWAVTE